MKKNPDKHISKNYYYEIVKEEKVIDDAVFYLNNVGYGFKPSIEKKLFEVKEWRQAYLDSK